MMKIDQIKFIPIVLFIFLLGLGNICAAQGNKGQFERAYKKLNEGELKMTFYTPANFDESKSYPAIIYFFGGGWVGRNIDQFVPFAIHAAARGMVAIIADYRTKSSHQTTPFESLKDAKSAMRYIRKNAEKLNIDPDRIIASGGSAGGHLAAATFTNESINEETDDLAISSKPNALILFNPVIDNGEGGYGFDRIGSRYLEFSPIHNIREGFPPTIFFIGDSDELIPVLTAERFKERVEEVGSSCELYIYEGQKHGFFNQSIFHEDLFSKMDTFTKNLNYIGWEK